MPKQLTHDEFCKRVSDRYGKEYTVLGQYIRNHDPIMLKHNKCGHEWGTTSPYDFLKPKPNNCPKCATHRSWSYTAEEFSQKLKDLTGNEYTLISSYVNNKTHVLLRHKTCGKDWKTRPDLFHNGTRCPCNQTKSKTSIAVKEVLDEVEIVYEEEKTFDWLKLEFGLRIDFFLPEYNLAIECDGEQHYISKQGREAEFPKTMNRDKTKFKLCKEHGIEVIRVPSLHGMMTSAFIIKQLYERDIIDLEI